MTRRLLMAALCCGFGPAGAMANDLDAKGDFPTLARVEYVIGCMNQRGAETYDTLYGCSCTVDHLRSQFSYDEYSEAETYRQLRGTPGERGGMFRDPEQADLLRDKLAAALETAEKRCFIKNLSAN